MNKKSRVAQMKHRRRKETLKERAKAARPAGTRTALLPARTKYEIEETAAATVKAAKPKAAAHKAEEVKPEAKAIAKPEGKAATTEAKPKAAAKPKAEAPAAEAKPKAHKPAAEKPAKAE